MAIEFSLCRTRVGGGGANLSSPSDKVVPFLGYLFIIESRFMVIDCNNFLHFPDLKVWFFLKFIYW